MVAKRIGAAFEVETVAGRAVSSGHLHECPDGRVGVYLGSQDVASGERLTLHTCERLQLEASAFAATTAGAAANFNFTTQKLVASGGTNCGTYLEAKALNATSARVILNGHGATA